MGDRDYVNRLGLNVVEVTQATEEAWRAIHNTVIPASPLSADVDQMTSDWDSATSAAEIDAAAADGLAWKGTASGGSPLSVDIADLVASWIAGDAPNFGIRVRDAGTAGIAMDGLTAGSPSGRPSLTISYVPAGPPEGVRELHALTGDGGARLSWRTPRDGGSTSGVDHYMVVVKDAGGETVFSQPVQGTAVTVGGLPNAASFTVTVSAVGAVGTSVATSLSFSTTATTRTPTALATTADYLAAQNQLASAATTSSIVAAAGTTSGAMYSTVLAAQAPGLVAEAGLVEQLGAIPSAAQQTVPTLSNTVVIEVAAGRLSVVATVSTTQSIVQDDGTSQDSTESNDQRFDFAVDDSGNLTLQAVKSPEADQAPDVNVGPGDTETGTVVDSSEPESVIPSGSSATSGFNATNATFASPSAKTFTESTRQAMVNWALRHYHDEHTFSPNCTNFVSRILHNGGGAPTIDRYADSSKRDNRNWYKKHHKQFFAGLGHLPSEWTSSSYSWGGSWNLRQFLYLHGSLVSEFAFAHVGDVVFYEWKQGSATHHHTAMVSRKAGTSTLTTDMGNFYVVQSQHDYKYRRIKDALANIKSDGGKNIKVFIIRVGSIR